MSATAARRARQLHVRTVKHRAAVVRLATANAVHDAIARISHRVSMLREDVQVSASVCYGHELQSQIELVERLDRAQAGLALSLADSVAFRAARQAERLAAHVAEERAGLVQATALRRDAAERDLRAAASYPPRFRKVGEPL